METVATIESKGLRRRLLTALLIIGVFATALWLLHRARQQPEVERRVWVDPGHGPLAERPLVLHAI